jgi:subtilisin family serine protease
MVAALFGTLALGGVMTAWGAPVEPGLGLAQNPQPAESELEMTLNEEIGLLQLPIPLEEFDEERAARLQAEGFGESAVLVEGPAQLLSVLVHLDPDADRPAGRAAAPSAVRLGVRQFAAARNLRVRYEYEILPNVINLRGLTPADVADVRRLPGVVRVEEDKIYHVSLHDSIPLIRGLESQKTAAGLSARGTGVRVCIVDTGINASHVMFTGRIDSAAGFDHFNNDPNPADDHGHGSNVAGIAAGGDGFTVNMGTCGVEPFQGVAPGATIIAMKVCSSSGSCPTSDIVAGINDCASTSLPGGQADVINISLGGGQFSGFCDTDASAAAANNAVAAGVTVVAAAGNNGFTNALSSPACGSQVIPVGAVYDSNFPNCEDTNSSFTWCLDSFCFSRCTDSAPILADERICFSNRSVNLELTAPGGGIWSAGIASSTSIIEMFGTSQASPHVAGLAALLLGEDPTLTPAEVLQLLRDGAIDLGPAGFDNEYGWGRIDVINSLNLLGPGCTTNADCDDGLFCNGPETCVSGSCQAGADPCPGQLCRESDDTCVNCLTNGDCSDGQFCNGSETCNASGNCEAGTPPNCDDAIACTADSCNEGTDQCDHAPNNALCDNGLFCDGPETCNPSSGCVAGSPPCGAGECDEVNDVCVGGGAQLYLTFKDSAVIPGVGTVQDEDIVAYDVVAGTWSWIFDGSDVGLGAFEIDGLAVLPGGDFLLSFTVAGTIAGISTDDSDILRFTPTSLGSTTAGTFSMYFDGSDVGLSTDAEDVDAIALTSTGNLLLSTAGSFTVTGLSGQDEDLIQFSATSLGNVTAGSFSMYFDGSDVGLATTADEDVDGAGLDSAGNILLSTLGPFSVTGVSGDDEDVLEFAPTSLGSTTAGTYSMFLDLSAIGIDPTEDVGELELIE